MLRQRGRRWTSPVLLHVHTQKGRGCEYAVEDPCRFHSPAAAHGQRAAWSEFPTPARPTVDGGLRRAAAGAPRRRTTASCAITAAMPDGTGLAALPRRASRPVHRRRHQRVARRGHGRRAGQGGPAAGRGRLLHLHAAGLRPGLPGGLPPEPAGACSAWTAPGWSAPTGPCTTASWTSPSCGRCRAWSLMAPGRRGGAGRGAGAGAVAGRPVRHPLPARRWRPPSLAGRVPAVRARPGPRCSAQGPDGTFLCYGAMVETALAAADTAAPSEGLDVAVVNARFAKPLDEALIGRLLAAAASRCVDLEDHALAGGFGSAVLELAGRARLADGQRPPAGPARPLHRPRQPSRATRRGRPGRHRPGQGRSGIGEGTGRGGRGRDAERAKTMATERVIVLCGSSPAISADRVETILVKLRQLADVVDVSEARQGGPIAPAPPTWRWSWAATARSSGRPAGRPEERAVAARPPCRRRRGRWVPLAGLADVNHVRELAKLDQDRLHRRRRWPANFHRTMTRWLPWFWPFRRHGLVPAASCFTNSRAVFRRSASRWASAICSDRPASAM